jgi:hypothetical protein
MTVSSETDSTRELIQVLVKFHEDMLKIPGLSDEQKDDIKKVREQLDTLILQTDEAEIKLKLIEIMNTLN